jgi:regulator of PEP synthase PpsR (kinase-PPPase family)
MCFTRGKIYSMSDKGATTLEILEYNLMSKFKIKGTLTIFISDKDDKYIMKKKV